MSELKRLLVLFVAFVAFLLAAYIQGTGTWRGPHNLRKSLPAKGATIGMQGGRYSCDGCYVSVSSQGRPALISGRNRQVPAVASCTLCRHEISIRIGVCTPEASSYKDRRSLRSYPLGNL